MTYKISKEYCYNDNQIVDMYLINGVPFTFDELEEEQLSDITIICDAEFNPKFTTEDLYRFSVYLIQEEIHPCLFSIELENPKDMPDLFEEDFYDK